MDNRENTQEMRAMLNADSRRQSHVSNAEPEAIEEEADPTFFFALPEIQGEPLTENSPVAIGIDDEPLAASQSEAEEIQPPHGYSESEADQSAHDQSELEHDQSPHEYSDEEASAAANESQAAGATLTAVPFNEQAGKPAKKRKKREFKVSRSGVEYPSLPTAVIKRVVSGFAGTNGSGNAKINRETVAALSQATDWFFEQVSEDLASYSEHAGRKTIDEADVITLMRRYVDCCMDPNLIAFLLT